MPCVECTAKNSLPSDDNNTHGKESPHGKELQKRTAKSRARQRLGTAHGKETLHGKDCEKLTAKRNARQRHCRVTSFAVRYVRLHGKGSFAVHFAFAVRLLAIFSFPFYFTYFKTYIDYLNMTSTLS